MRTLLSTLLLATCLNAQPRRGAAPRQLPDGPGQAAVRTLCGSSCHGVEIVMGRAMVRDQWGQVLSRMVTHGAKMSETEFAQILDYLSSNFPARAAVAGPPARGGGGLTAGPDDAHVVDPVAAGRGKTIYIAECITCHGNKARGPNDNVPENQRGSDLVRSLVVLKDRYGSMIGAFLRKGHQTQSGNPSASFTPDQMTDLAHFLHDKVGDTLRSGPYNQILDVLTGDARAGAVYFNGAGGCKNCHSPSGDLAGIGKRYDPPTLQSRFLFPRTVGFGRRGGGISSTKPVTVTVTPQGQPPVSGVLDKIDDFNVSLRDADGEYRAFKRTPSLKVERQDPYAAHIELLDKYTDKNMHDIVAYLATLK